MKKFEIHAIFRLTNHIPVYRPWYGGTAPDPHAPPPHPVQGSRFKVRGSSSSSCSSPSSVPSLRHSLAPRTSTAIHAKINFKMVYGEPCLPQPATCNFQPSTPSPFHSCAIIRLPRRLVSRTNPNQTE